MSLLRLTFVSSACLSLGALLFGLNGCNSGSSPGQMGQRLYPRCDRPVSAASVSDE